MKKLAKVCIIIPAYNEADGIGPTLDSIPAARLKAAGYSVEKLVVDNASTDGTAEVARQHGARVVHEAEQGKGNAMQTGFYNISDDAEYIVMLDGDDTYKSYEMLRLLEPLSSGFADVIIGSRMGGKIKKGSMRGFNRLGNWLFSFLVRVTYQVNVTDTLTGYFAWKRDTIIKLRPYIKSNGFAIEMEMITKMARMGFQIYSVPITYEPRRGESALRPIGDGVRILGTWAHQLHWKPRPEKIAFVTDAIYPYNRGGKETRLHEITKRLVKEGREVHIYTMKWWEGPSHIVREGVHLHAVCRLHPLYKNDKRSIVSALLFSAACFRLLFAKFDAVDVDQIPFLPLYSMRIVCWLKGKRLYASWHEVWGADYWQDYLGLGGKLAALTERVAFKLPDVIISNSQNTTDKLVQAGVKKSIRTIPLGVDLDKIFAAPEHTLHSDIIYVGRLMEHKKVDMLLRAVALVKQAKPKISCIIVGNGPERVALERLTSELDLQSNITFFNSIEDNAELYGLMKASKMLVQPSIREGFGLVVVEANACDIPVITTSHKLNAARDLIIEGKNGLLTEVNAECLAQKISAVLDGPKMHPAETLEEQFGQYRWTSVVEQIERVFGSTLG
jgi:glycosyltransferase involved in cell wall biosynthesis